MSKRGKEAFFTDDAFKVEAEVEVQEQEQEVVVEQPVSVADPVDDLSAYAAPTGTQGKKGQKVPRMNLAIPEDVYEYIRRESRRNGMTYSEFICAVMRQRASNQ